MVKTDGVYMNNSRVSVRFICNNDDINNFTTSIDLNCLNEFHESFKVGRAVQLIYYDEKDMAVSAIYEIDNIKPIIMLGHLDSYIEFIEISIIMLNYEYINFN